MNASAVVFLVAGLLTTQSSGRPDVIWEKGTIAVHKAKDLPAGIVPLEADHSYLMRSGVYWGRNYYPNPDHSGIERKLTCYHHEDGPVGLALNRYDWFPIRPRNYAANDLRMPASLIGLGSGPQANWSMLLHSWSEPPLAETTMSCGTLAGIGRPFQTIRFFEHDERLFELCDPAKGAPLFSYVRDARNRGVNVELHRGAEREVFAKQACEDFYGAIFVQCCPRERLEDIAVELMTREGMRRLVKALRPDGILCYHTSNRYMAMTRPLADVAADLGFSSIVVQDTGGLRGPKVTDPSHYGSEWVMITPDDATFDPIRREAKTRKSLKVSPARVAFDELGDPIDLNIKYLWTDTGPKRIDKLFRTSPVLAHKQDEARRGDPAALIYILLTKVIPDTEGFFLSEWHRTVPSAEFLRQEPSSVISRERVAEWSRRFWADPLNRTRPRSDE